MTVNIEGLGEVTTSSDAYQTYLKSLALVGIKPADVGLPNSTLSPAKIALAALAAFVAYRVLFGKKRR